MTTKTTADGSDAACLGTISTCDAPGGRPAAFLATDGDRLVTVSADGLVAVWSGVAVAQCWPGEGPVECIAAGDGLVAIVRGGRELVVRGIADGGVPARWPITRGDVFTGCAVVGANRVLAASEERSGHPTDRVAWLQEYLVSTPAEPPRLLAQGQGTLPPWSSTATYEHSYPDHERVPFGGATRAALGLPGHQIVAIDHPIGWLVLRSNEGALTARAPDGALTALHAPGFEYGVFALTPDTRHLIAWDPTGTVALFEVATGTERGRWRSERWALDAVRAVTLCAGCVVVLEGCGRVRWLRGP